MMPEQEFVAQENWYGSHYELGIAYAPYDDQHLESALQTIWQHPLLDGPVNGPYSTEASPFAPTALPTVPQNGKKRYGVLHVLHRRAVGCLSLVIIPDSNGDSTSTVDQRSWVLLCVPTGMLGLAYPIEYPIVGTTNPWIAEFEALLLDIADTVFVRSPFDMAVIGEEATAFADDAQPLTADRVNRGGYLLSPHLYEMIQPQRMPERRPNGLLWFPWAT